MFQMDTLKDDEESTPLETIKKQPMAFSRNQQPVDSSSSSVVKKSLFGIQRNVASVPNAAESNVPVLIKKQQTIRGTPPPVPPNKPVIPPKKDLLSFIKKPSFVENAVPIPDKEQKNLVLRPNNFTTNNIITSDKPD